MISKEDEKRLNFGSGLFSVAPTSFVQIPEEEVGPVSDNCDNCDVHEICDVSDVFIKFVMFLLFVMLVKLVNFARIVMLKLSTFHSMICLNLVISN